MATGTPAVYESGEIGPPSDVDGEVSTGIPRSLQRSAVQESADAHPEGMEGSESAIEVDDLAPIDPEIDEEVDVVTKDLIEEQEARSLYAL